MEDADVIINEMEANQPANREIDEVHNQPEEAGTDQHVNSISVTLEDRFRTLMDSDASVEEEDNGHKPLIGQVSMLLGMKSELKKNFQPRIMSIGPLHYDETDLKQGQKLKCQLAKLFIGKSKRSKETLYNNILKEIESFKKYYDQNELLKKFHGNDEDLAWMFFVDGCALIQLVLCWFEDELYDIADDQMDLLIRDLLLLDNQLPLEVLNLVMGFSKEGELLYPAKLRTLICRFIKIIATINFRRWEKGVKADSVSFNKAYHLLGLIWMDLVKEETDCRSDNTKATSGHFGSVKDPQAAGIIVKPENSSSSGDIPVQVIEEGRQLHQKGHSVGRQSTDLGQSISRLFKTIVTTINIKRWEKGLKPSSSFNKNPDYLSDDNTKATSRQFRSVKDLQAAGIILEPNNPGSSLRDISFHRGFCFCKLKITSFGVSEQGKFLLFNLIAFEMHPHSDKDRVVTSYIRFLNSLIATKEDVAELRKVRILFNYLPNDEEVLNTFRELTSSLKPYSDIFSETKEELIDYFNDKKSMTTGKWLSEAMHVYFGSPWTAIAFVSATVVLILTIIQTILSFLTYFQCR